MREEDILKAQEKFGMLIRSEQKRIEREHNGGGLPDYKSMEKIIIGVIPGDGIGPIIMEQALRVLHRLADPYIEQGKIELRIIQGLSVEERAAKNDTLPAECLAELKKCTVVLKGPMTTPRPGDPWPPLPSVIARIRRELELDVALRPVSNPNMGIDWVMFRENIEGAYVWGSKGIQVDEDLAVDFVVETKLQSLHVARMAFEYARANGRRHVTAVSKCNIVKLTDGNFLAACRQVAQDYPEINYDERLVDITASKLNDKEFTQNLEVLVLPNLYGDIVSDVAAEVCGGVSTAGSANLGSKYALFEAIHGTAPYLMNNGLGEYADPSSLFRAVVMLLKQIGYQKESALLEKALDICGYKEKKVVVTAHKEDATTKEYADYVLETIDRLAAEAEA